jgi:hypothetical protein
LLTFLLCGFYTLFLNNKNIFKKNIINARPASSTSTIVPTYNQSVVNLSNKNNNNNNNDDILPSYESITLFHIT